MKTTLTIEQSARLIDLGIDAKLASEIEYRPKSGGYGRIGYRVYSLADLLSILPKEIEDNGVTEDLNIIMSNDSVYVSYPYIHERLKVFIVARELIDALYQLLIWCLENNFINKECVQ